MPRGKAFTEQTAARKTSQNDLEKNPFQVLATQAPSPAPPAPSRPEREPEPEPGPGAAAPQARRSYRMCSAGSGTSRSQ